MPMWSLALKLPALVVSTVSWLVAGCGKTSRYGECQVSIQTSQTGALVKTVTKLIWHWLPGEVPIVILPTPSLPATVAPVPQFACGVGELPVTSMWPATINAGFGAGPVAGYVVQAEVAIGAVDVDAPNVLRARLVDQAYVVRTAVLDRQGGRAALSIRREGAAVVIAHRGKDLERVVRETVGVRVGDACAGFPHRDGCRVPLIQILDDAEGARVAGQTDGPVIHAGRESRLPPEDHRVAGGDVLDVVAVRRVGQPSVRVDRKIDRVAGAGTGEDAGVLYPIVVASIAQDSGVGRLQEEGIGVDVIEARVAAAVGKGVVEPRGKTVPPVTVT